MPTSPADAARHFADDLKRAREARNVGLERLYEAARIPLDVLQSFERDGLANNRMFNRVYLRSLVRTYADVVGLPVPLVLDALDAALDGRYDGEVRAYTEGKPPQVSVASTAESVEPSPEPETSAAPTPEPAGATSGTPAASAAVPTPAEAVAVAVPTPAQAAAAAVPTPAQVVAAPDRGGASRPALAAEPAALPEEQAPAREDSSTPGVAAPAAAKEIAPPPEPPARIRREVTPEPPAPTAYSIPSPEPGFSGYEVDRGMPAWAKIALGLLALVLVAGGLFWWLSQDDERARTPPPAAAQRAPAATPPDTSAAAPATPSAPVALPDTLTLVVAATGGPLRELRITVDDDVRRPYWLEQGTSRTFPFRDSLVVTNPPAEATLTVQGRPVPASARQASGNVVLRRSALAAGN